MLEEVDHEIGNIKDISVSMNPEDVRVLLVEWIKPPAFIVKQNLFRSRVDVRQLGAKVYATIHEVFILSVVSTRVLRRRRHQQALR